MSGNAILENLRKWFGFDSLRDGQEPVVRALLEGRPALAVCVPSYMGGIEPAWLALVPISRPGSMPWSRFVPLEHDDNNGDPQQENADNHPNGFGGTILHGSAV